jgi:hypothetical protein
MVPQNLSKRHGAPAVPDLVRILLSHSDIVRFWLMTPNSLFQEFFVRFINFNLVTIFSILKHVGENPRWQQEGGNRQHEPC